MVLLGWIVPRCVALPFFRARLLVKAEVRALSSSLQLLVGSHCYELKLWWEVPMSVLEVVPKVRQLEGGLLLFGGEAGEVGPSTVGNVGEIAMKMHAERSNRPTESAVVISSTKSDRDASFVAEEAIGGMKGKGKRKVGENGLGLIDLGLKKGVLHSRQDDVGWATEVVVSVEDESNGIGPVRPGSVEERAPMECPLNRAPLESPPFRPG